MVYKISFRCVCHGPIDFSKDDGEKEVRQYAREFEGCVRLPKGFECWPA